VGLAAAPPTERRNNGFSARPQFGHGFAPDSAEPAVSVFSWLD
jgi:hypothetical protein